MDAEKILVEVERLIRRHMKAHGTSAELDAALQKIAETAKPKTASSPWAQLGKAQVVPPGGE